MSTALAIDTSVLQGAPATWGRRPLWTLVSRRDETNRPDAELLSVYRDHGVIPKSSRDDNFNKPSEDLSTYRYVRPSDLVLNKMKTWQGSLAVSEFEGIVSPAYFVCELSPDVFPRFAHHLLRSHPYIHLYQAASKGIRPNQWDLPFEDFRVLPMLLPPFEEQRRIAAFLDIETIRIDALSNAMRLQLDLLNQRRLRVIDLIWDGLEKTPRNRLGYALTLATSGSRGWGDYVAESGAIFFRSANLQADNIRPKLTNLAYVQVPQHAIAEAARSRISVGDVLVGITGANSGWVALADDTVVGGHVSQHVCLVRPDRRQVIGEWLAYLVASPVIQDKLMGSQYGGTKTQLSLPDVRDLRIPVIPIAQQNYVSDKITQQLAEIHRQRGLRERQLSLLAERRTALITAAVTGQFDVSTASGRGVTE